jgi:hypothetical protein
LWKPCDLLVDSAGRYLAAQTQELTSLLRESCNRLKPLEDPLLIKFHLHRWLARQREESYSDWLAWLLCEVDSNQVGKLLFGEGAPAEIRDTQNPCVAEREVPVEEGYPGSTGRLDIVLRFDHSAVVVVEVKRSQAEIYELGKHDGYQKWLHGEQNQRVSCRRAVLLHVDEEKRSGENVGSGFQLLRWDDFCQRGRALIPELVQANKVVTAALLAAFLGSVEMNLLELPSLHWVHAQNDQAQRSHALRLGLQQIERTTKYLRGLTQSEVTKVIMEDDISTDDLIAHGSGSYPDVVNALTAFESEVHKTAKTILAERLDELRMLTAQPALSINNVVLVSDLAGGDRRVLLSLGGIAVGVSIDLRPLHPNLYYLRCGLRWRKPQNTEDSAAYASLAIGTNRSKGGIALRIFESCSAETGFRFERHNG